MKKAFKYALKKSFPIFISFIPIGIAYGMIMSESGYNILWTEAVNIAVLAGGLQFAMVPALIGEASFLTVAVLAVLINSRLTFYGLTLMEKFRGTGKIKPFLIYTIIDETYALNCMTIAQPDVEPHKYYFANGVLIPVYWFITTAFGSLLGAVLPFSLDGIDFAMNAMFIAIFLDQLKEAKNPIPAIIAIASGIACRLIFDATSFMLPTLVITVLLMVIFRKQIETPMGKKALQAESAASIEASESEKEVHHD